MNEQAFFQAITDKSKEFNMNPLLLLSGIEGLYTFRDVQLNSINYELLDSLILTIFALRVGDQFHTIAEERLSSGSHSIRTAATAELEVLPPDYIAASKNQYLQSFAQVLNGKGVIRKYHEKALEVAAIEIKKMQMAFGTDSIGIVMLTICKEDADNTLGLSSLFRA